MQERSDYSLVSCCINGDRAAWDKFVQRYSALIFWAIKENLNRTNYPYNQHDIEDIFQNVFILLWEKGKLKQIRNRKNITAWLVMVAANCARNFFRNKKEFLPGKELLPDTLDSFDSSIVNQESATNIIEKVLELLSPQELIILKLSYLYNRTHQEIGQILKIPTSTVSSIIKRVKAKLKARLEYQN